MVLRRGLVALALVVTSACAVAACSGSNNADRALKYAKDACAAFLPKVDNAQASNDDEAHQAYAAVHAAAGEAAKAANLDAKWNDLSRAEQAMLDAWQYDIDVILNASKNDAGQAILSDQQQAAYQPLFEGYQSGARTARAECAKANAS
jgi:hypothetical protein